LLEQDSQNALLWYGSSLVSYRKGDYAWAIECSKRCAQIMPGFYDCYYALVASYDDQKGDLEEAVDYVKALIQAHPDSPGPYSALGNVKRLQKKWDEAFQAYFTGLEKARKIEDLESELGLLSGISFSYRDSYNYQEAIEFLEQSLKIRRELGYEEY